MTKQSLLLFAFSLAALAFTSCQIKKKYFYVEGSKEEKLIKAYSDSAAYLEAYYNFEISKRVYRDMNSPYLSEPVSFKLLNDKHEDITDKVIFANKDSLENSIAKRINDLPSIEQSREEKNDAQKYSDSLILNEQDKAIGDIKFGMNEKEVKSLINKFQNETKKPDRILGKPYYDYFIGTYEYSAIRDYYVDKQLYKIKILGTTTSWEYYNSEMSDIIDGIVKVLKEKFGEPDTFHPIPERYQMENGYTYLIRAWDIGKKELKSG